MITFRETDFLNFSDSEWNSFHQFRKRIHSQYYPGEPVTDDKSFEEQMKSRMTREAEFDFGIYNDDLLIGSFEFRFFKDDSPHIKGNEKIAFFGIQMLKDYRRRGIGTEALKKITDTCEKNHKELFMTSSHVPETNRFFEAIGAKTVQKATENTLKLNELDWQMIDDWIQEGQNINPKTKIITIIGAIPEEILDQYLKTVNESANSQPHDDREEGEYIVSKEEQRDTENKNAKNKITTLTTIALEENGEVSGFTVLKRIPGKEKAISQGLTGVPIKYRGKKLGKWVKAQMLKYIKDNYPDTESIKTVNAKTNESMVYINRKLGFKKSKEYVMVQVTLDQLKTYFNSKNSTESN